MNGSRSGSISAELWSTVRVALAAGGVLALLAGRAADPAWVERQYVDGWGVTIASNLAQVSSWAPFSVAEALLAALITYELWHGLAGASDVAAGRRRAPEAAARGALHLIRVAAVLLTWFYVAWGTAYARPPAITRQGWANPQLDRPEARMQLYVEAAQTVALANRYQAIASANGAAPPTGKELDAAIDRGYRAAADALGMPASFARPRGPAKTPVLSELMSWGGIGGIYLPFTGEANVNGGPPAFSRILTAAHEKAHQRMVTSEDEASFYGFLACAHADEPYLRYAAWEFASRQLISSLATVDPDAARAVRDVSSAGVQADQKMVAEYWRPYRGWTQDIGRWINDHYLRANRVSGGVASYGRAGKLIVAWLNTKDGVALSGLPHTITALPADPPAP